MTENSNSNTQVRYEMSYDKPSNRLNTKITFGVVEITVSVPNDPASPTGPDDLDFLVDNFTQVYDRGLEVLEQEVQKQEANAR